MNKSGLGRVADFHALRHSYITALAKAGVHPRVAQAMARHSSIDLTMKRYTHVDFGNQVEALAMVPSIFPTRLDSKFADNTTSDATATSEGNVAANTTEAAATIGSSVVNGDVDGKIIVSDFDSCKRDRTANTRTYRDNEIDEKVPLFEGGQINNPLHSNELQGVEMLAPRKGIEPLSTAPESGQLNIQPIDKSSSYDDSKMTLTGPLTDLREIHEVDLLTTNLVIPFDFADFGEIATAWTKAPHEIRLAVKAILKQYIDCQEEKADKTEAV